MDLSRGLLWEDSLFNYLFIPGLYIWYSGAVGPLYCVTVVMVVVVVVVVVVTMMSRRVGGLEFFGFYSVICETNEFSAVSTKKIGLLRLSAGIISKIELS